MENRRIQQSREYEKERMTQYQRMSSKQGQQELLRKLICIVLDADFRFLSQKDNFLFLFN
jgi:hypothetical protein